MLKNLRAHLLLKRKLFSLLPPFNPEVTIFFLNIDFFFKRLPNLALSKNFQRLYEVDFYE